MIRQSKSAYVERIAVLKNTQLSTPEEILNGRRTHHIAIAVLKNTQLSPPDIKEKETSPEEMSIPAFACSAVLKKTQLSPPEITNKNILLVIWRTDCKEWYQCENAMF